MSYVPVILVFVVAGGLSFALVMAWLEKHGPRSGGG